MERKNELANPRSFQLLEDNGGGILLAVFGASDLNEVVFFEGGFEHDLGNLAASIEALLNGADPVEENWDWACDEPQLEYEKFTDYPTGWEIVADEERLTPAAELGYAGGGAVNAIRHLYFQER